MDLANRLHHQQNAPMGAAAQTHGPSAALGAGVHEHTAIRCAPPHTLVSEDAYTGEYTTSGLEDCSTASDSVQAGRKRGAAGNKENGSVSTSQATSLVPTDKRKERRRTSNRECARRIRGRRGALLSALDDKVRSLRTDNDKLTSQLEEITECWEEISSINSKLRQQLIGVADGVHPSTLTAIVRELGTQEADPDASAADLQQLQALLETLPAFQQHDPSSGLDTNTLVFPDKLPASKPSREDFPEGLFGFADELQSQSQAFLAERRLQLEPAAVSRTVSPAAALKPKPAALVLEGPVPMSPFPLSPPIMMPDAHAFPLPSPSLMDLPALPSPISMVDWLPEDLDSLH
ncbi:hypothetical protein WJX72_001662 [[Myrmecia] bisecta]|uniref:BZIP domain-containing protein n=1 Tax=[Myrmecia] bisecta TaxID=41462 RepID=A0AAW1QBI3_9CHLO